MFTLQDKLQAQREIDEAREEAFAEEAAEHGDPEFVADRLVDHDEDEVCYSTPSTCWNCHGRGVIDAYFGTYSRVPVRCHVCQPRPSSC